MGHHDDATLSMIAGCAARRCHTLAFGRLLQGADDRADLPAQAGVVTEHAQLRKQGAVVDCAIFTQIVAAQSGAGEGLGTLAGVEAHGV